MAERTIEYSAQVEAAQIATAERAFYIRSLRELQFWWTVVPPIAFAIALFIGVALQAAPYFFWVFGVFLVLSVARPILFLLLRPVAVAAHARKFPDRRVRIDERAIHITTGGRESSMPWAKVRRIWDTENYTLVVLNPLMALHLPKKGMPDGTLEFISARVGT
ncbi:MAG: YcxB-like protein, partial [Betaproteobacteria bacterium]|nr:YcxB-like protein [Betaproteobacteria bacterium]